MVKIFAFKRNNKNKNKRSCHTFDKQPHDNDSKVLSLTNGQPGSSARIAIRRAPPMKKVLFEGPMSITYVGQDTETKETVVVKVLSAALNNSAYNANREVFITELVQPHPHIARLVSIDKTEETNPALSFEFATEGDVFDLLGRFEKDQLPFDLAQRCFSQVALAVAHLHANGVAWRDAKPENVLVTTDSKTGELSFRITDFGLSEHFPPNTRPMTNRCSGTEQFAAPEVFQTGTTRLHFNPFKADVWSIAIFLYRIVFGKLPEIQNQLPGRQGLATPNTFCVPANTNPLLGDLLVNMLCVSPDRRPCIGEVVAHPFVTTAL